jgi:phospholipid/cholesterol/gamma-HCH transport system substrate-binding protein
VETRGSYVVVGLFVLLVGVAMVASLFWLAGWGERAHATYLVLMEESVSGLTADAPVKFRGVDVGRVASLDLRPENPEVVQLTLSVDPDTPILEDTRARLEFQGFTGLAFVNLVGGTRDGAPLRASPGEDYPVIESAPSILVRLDNGISDLLVSVTGTSDRLSGLLDEVDAEKLARTVANLERLTSALADSSADLAGAIDGADRFLASAADAGERLPALVDRIDSLAAEWERTGRTVRETAAAGTEELQRMTGEVTGDVQALSADLRRLVGRLDQLVMELEEDPSMFLYGRTGAPPGPGE